MLAILAFCRALFADLVTCGDDDPLQDSILDELEPAKLLGVRGVVAATEELDGDAGVH
jgi:hypothetical protein